MIKYRVLFDNQLTVAFSIFMSIWSVLFLEFWERRSATLAHRWRRQLVIIMSSAFNVSNSWPRCTVLYCRWGVYQHDPEEEHPRPEYLAQLERVEARTLNPVTRTLEPRPPFWGMQVLQAAPVLYCTLQYFTILHHIAGAAAAAVLDHPGPAGHPHLRRRVQRHSLQVTLCNHIVHCPFDAVHLNMFEKIDKY